MGMPAIREGDACACAPHFEFGALAAPPPRTVRVNGRTIVVQTDTCGCKAGPAIVTVGSATVRVNGLGPARLGETSLRGGGHFGQFLDGSPNVRVGGPAIVGDLDRWVKACIKARAGRASFNKHRRLLGMPDDYRQDPQPDPTDDFPDNSPHQQANNCGLEAIRNVVEEYRGVDLDEWDFLQRAIDAGHANWKSPPRDAEGRAMGPAPARDLAGTDEARAWREVNPEDGGGTRDDDLIQVMSSNGVDPVDIHDPKRPYDPNDPKSKARQRVAEVTSTVAEGRPVVAKVDGGNTNHVVLIVAVELDAEGEPAFFYVNDSSFRGGCGVRVPIANFTGPAGAKGRQTPNEFMSVPQIAPRYPPPPRR